MSIVTAKDALDAARLKSERRLQNRPKHVSDFREGRYQKCTYDNWSTVRSVVHYGVFFLIKLEP